MEMPARMQASACASTHVTAEDFIGADAAVVAALRRGEAVVRPAQGTVSVEEGVLLLDAEPGLLLFVLLGHFAQVGAGVAPVHRAVRIEHFAEDEDVAVAVQRVGDLLDGTEHQIAEMAGGLAGARSVIAPLGDVGERLDRVDDLGLRSQLCRRFSDRRSKCIRP